MSDYILALDQGTTSSRAILFDREGNVRASANQEFHQHYPQPGWVEHDAEEIWQSQLAVTRRVLVESEKFFGRPGQGEFIKRGACPAI